MIQLVITQATMADLPRLQSIASETFLESFAAMNSEANMRAYMNEAFSAEKLAAELAEENSTFYLATMDDEVIGYLKINNGNAQTELVGDSAIEIERIYVRKAYHGRKVGQHLLDKALEVARKIHVEQVWLGVWEENPRAIRFYKKNGFMPFGTHVFLMGDDPQTDILMHLKVQD